jgi:cytochrome c peroxidase
VQFWDGRAATLEDQAKGPPANPIEMGMTDLDAVAKRIQAIPGYKPYFDKAFGKGENITIDTIAKAIASYERTLITPNAPYDRYVRGEKKAMNSQQVRGMQKFSDAGCIACHSGANFNGPSMPVGVGFYQKFPTFTDNSYVTRYGLTDDDGRMASTGKVEDKNMWRVPTLRNLAYTAPYMHTGNVNSLDEAVRLMAKTQLNKSLEESDVADIVAFLGSISGEFPQQTMPRLPATPGGMID